MARMANDNDRNGDHDREAARLFECHRARLVGLGYRLLGRLGEAEEVVQDAFLRWLASPRQDVRDPEAFLVTTVTRLALDRLKSARARREDYVGPWLPEPVVTSPGAPGALDLLEQRDLVSLGLLRLLEQLSANERAVFVLREAFELPYDDIAAMLGLESSNCRQLHGRAQKHLGGERTHAAASREDHLRLLAGFFAATQRGDLDGLRSLLSADVAAYGDGGGRVRTTRKVVRGADRVARLYLGIERKYPHAHATGRIADVNGRPAMVIERGGTLHVISFDVHDGCISNVYDVANPDKLAYLTRQLAAPEAAPKPA
jgi:RNA polymerase sigma-70 factor (ECF subfamily)